MEALLNVPKGFMRIIPLETADRKKLHQYLEKHHPEVGKTSFKLKRYYEFGDIIARYIQCYECDHKRVKLDQYHYGMMDNNQDEYRTGTCKKCGECVSFECNYDDYDDITFIRGNNCVVIGEYFRYYNPPSHSVPGDVTLSEILDILKHVDTHDVADPQPYVKKRHIQTYLDEMLATPDNSDNEK